MKLFLRIRSHAGEAAVQVWLMQGHGAAESWLLYNGEMIPSVADELAEALGLPVEREARDMGLDPEREPEAKTNLFE